MRHIDKIKYDPNSPTRVVEEPPKSYYLDPSDIDYTQIRNALLTDQERI